MIAVARQTGAVVVSSLIILALITVLLIQSMQSSSMQTLMAGNFSDYVEAIANAESALKRAEYFISQLHDYDRFDNDLSDALASDLYDDIWRQINWNNQAHNAEYGRYVIQHLATTVTEAQQHDSGAELLVFKITVRATSNNGRALVYIESLYNHTREKLANHTLQGRRSWREVRM